MRRLCAGRSRRIDSLGIVPASADENQLLGAQPHRLGVERLLVALLDEHALVLARPVVVRGREVAACGGVRNTNVQALDG